MHQIIRAIALGACALFALNAAAQQKAAISIATGPTGGVYYPMGGGMANILTKSIPGLSATAEATAGSVANLEFIGTGKADVAFSMADAAWDGYKGQEKFQGKPVPLRALMVLYPNRMHVVTKEGTGINRLADLKGKRVSTGAPRSATEVMAFRLLEAAGLSEKDLAQRERLTPQESAGALKDGKIDAFFWVGGIPTASVTDFAATPGIKIKLVDHSEVVDAMNKKYGPLYVTDVIPAKSYPGQETDNKIATVWNVLVASANLPDDVAYNIVKTMFEKKEDMVKVHAEARNFDMKYQTNAGVVIPFHPGAKKYLIEKGAKIQ